MAPMTIYDFDPRNLPQELLAAIGLATACSAQTESVVEQGIAGCLGVDFEYGSAVMTHMAAPLRDSVLRSVAEIRIDSPDDLDELDRLLDDVKAAYEKRNAIVHHSWCRDPNTGKLYTVKQTSRTRYEMSLIEMTVEQVNRDALFIYDAGMKLMAFLATRHLLPSAPAENRPRAHKSKAARTARRKKGLRK